MKKMRNKAQSFVEYAVLIAVAVAALIATKIYVTRSVQEKYRQSADVFGEGEQYEKGVTNSTETGTGIDVTEPPIPPDSACPIITARVAALTKEIEGYDYYDSGHDGDAAYRHHVQGLQEKVAFLEASKAGILVQAAEMRAIGFIDQATQLEESAQVLSEQAASLQEKIRLKTAKIEEYNTDYAHCFP